MVDDSNIGPVGLEDEAAFEANVTVAPETGADDQETTLLPEVKAAADGETPTGAKSAWAGKALGRFKLLRDD